MGDFTCNICIHLKYYAFTQLNYIHVCVYICTYGKIFSGVQNSTLAISTWWNDKVVFIHYKKISAIVLKLCKKSLKIRKKSAWSMCDKEKKYIKEMSHSPFPWKSIGSTSLGANTWTHRKKAQNTIPLGPQLEYIEPGVISFKTGHMGFAHFHVLSSVSRQVWRGARPKPQTTFKCINST